MIWKSASSTLLASLVSDEQNKICQPCWIKDKNCNIHIFKEQNKVQRERDQLPWPVFLSTIFVAQQHISFDTHKLVFAYGSRMNKLSYNYPGNKQAELCQCGAEMKK